MGLKAGVSFHESNGHSWLGVPKGSHISRKDILATEKKRSTMGEKEGWKSWQVEWHSSTDQGTMVPVIGWGCAWPVLHLVVPPPAALTPTSGACACREEKGSTIKKTTVSNLGAQQFWCGKSVWGWWGLGSIPPRSEKDILRGWRCGRLLGSRRWGLPRSVALGAGEAETSQWGTPQWWGRRMERAADPGWEGLESASSSPDYRWAYLEPREKA